MSASATKATPPPAGPTTAPPAESITVTIDGEQETVESNLPWVFVKDLESGEIGLRVGPGVLSTDFHGEGEVVASWDGPAVNTSARAARASWYCDPVAYDPRRSGGQIRGYVGATCHNGPMPTYRLQWQFERHAPITESITGWKRYSARKYTSWTSAMAIGTDVYAHCNTADGRTRAFTTYHRGETTGGYLWSWHRSPTSLSWFNCGYSEY